MKYWIFISLWAAAVLFVTQPSFSSVKDHSDRFSIGIAAETPDYILKISPADKEESRRVDYKPNQSELLGITGTAFGISASYLTQTGISDNDKVKKGKTSYDDIRLSAFLGSKSQFRIGGNYTRYSGFYIDNSQEIDTTLTPDDPFIQRKDLKLTQYGSTLWYIFSPEDFSAAASLSYSATQTKSGGSWILKTDYDHTNFKANSALIPSQVQASFGSDQLLESGTFSTLSLLGGYGHSFVFGRFFISPILFFGKGLQKRNYSINGYRNDSMTNATKINLTAAIGFNAEDFFAGLQFGFDELTYKTGSLELKTSLQYFRFTTGYRF